MPTLAELGVDLVLELGAPVLVDPAHDLVLGEHGRRDGRVVEGVDRLVPEGQGREHGRRLVSRVEQHPDPVGHRGTGGAVRRAGDAALVEGLVLIAGAPHERARAPHRVAADEGLGAVADEQQVALLEAPERGEPVEQREGDLLEVRLECLLAGDPRLAAGLEHREHELARGGVLRGEDTAARRRADPVGLDAPGGELAAGVLLQADPQLGDPGGEDRPDGLGDAPSGVRGHQIVRTVLPCRMRALISSLALSKASSTFASSVKALPIRLLVSHVV